MSGHMKVFACLIMNTVELYVCIFTLAVHMHYIWLGLKYLLLHYGQPIRVAQIHNVYGVAFIYYYPDTAIISQLKASYIGTITPSQKKLKDRFIREI